MGLPGSNLLKKIGLRLFYIDVVVKKTFNFLGGCFFERFMLYHNQL